MTKRIIIEGAPGSGKTTLIRGIGQYPEGKRVYCIEDLEYNVSVESISIVANEMRAEGKHLMQNRSELLHRTLDLEVALYQSTQDIDLIIHDKALPGYKSIADIFDVSLDETFSNIISKFSYDSPVFVCSPIIDFRFPNDKKKDSLFTPETRLMIHQAIISDYSRLGYKVIEVPFYSIDWDKNNYQRMKMIFESL